MYTRDMTCPRYGFDTADFYSRWDGEREDWPCTCGTCTDVPAVPAGMFETIVNALPDHYALDEYGVAV